MVYPLIITICRSWNFKEETTLKLRKRSCWFWVLTMLLIQLLGVCSVFADVSEIHSTSSIRVEVCRVGESLCIYKIMVPKTMGEELRVGVPSGTVERFGRARCEIQMVSGAFRGPEEERFICFHNFPGPLPLLARTRHQLILPPRFFRNINLCMHRKSSTLHTSTLKTEVACTFETFSTLSTATRCK
jgi:hypothetical protein